jgi:hypothetical protein
MMAAIMSLANSAPATAVVAEVEGFRCGPLDEILASADGVEVHPGRSSRADLDPVVCVPTDQPSTWWLMGTMLVAAFHGRCTTDVEGVALAPCRRRATRVVLRDGPAMLVVVPADPPQRIRTCGGLFLVGPAPGPWPAPCVDPLTTP